MTAREVLGEAMRDSNARAASPSLGSGWELGMMSVKFFAGPALRGFHIGLWGGAIYLEVHAPQIRDGTDRRKEGFRLAVVYPNKNESRTDGQTLALASLLPPPNLSSSTKEQKTDQNNNITSFLYLEG